jgi:hypothetical protein
MKMTRLFGLVICLLFITNLQAQKMHEYWKCEYEYNDADRTASVKLWNGAIGNESGLGMSWLGFDEGSNILVIPNSTVNPDNGLTYTVTRLQKGSTGIGWMVLMGDNGWRYFNQPIEVYIPKTIKSIESQVFKRNTEREGGQAATGDFWFCFEDERTYQYAIEYWKNFPPNYLADYTGVEDIAEAFADDWFVKGNSHYRLSYIDRWNVVRFNEEDTGITINPLFPTETSGEIGVYLNDNVITSISVIPSWVRITLPSKYLRSASEDVNIDEDFVFSYTLEANTGAARRGEIVLRRCQ